MLVSEEAQSRTIAHTCRSATSICNDVSTWDLRFTVLFLACEYEFWKEIIGSSTYALDSHLIWLRNYFTGCLDSLTVLPDGRLCSNASFRASSQFITYFGNTIGNIAMQALLMETSGICSADEFLDGKCSEAAISGDNSVLALENYNAGVFVEACA
eukprot:GHVP01053826.1.p3 GENE.GHVP01053826.1~~GHVP01053826.1.p3  ORF type:complete len:156 (+),score=8.53 GHVP01053826.1:231-698(+)